MTDDVAARNRPDDAPAHPVPRPGGVRRACLVAVVLAVASLLSNIQSDALIGGEGGGWNVARWTASQLLNSGTVWAGLGVLSGWLAGSPGPRGNRRGGLTAVLASELSLVAHYLLGIAVTALAPGSWVDMDWSIFAANRWWFVAALVLSGPLGMVGAQARRTGPGGLAARLVVPVGAVAEPLALRMLVSPWGYLDTPSEVATLVTGTVLLVGGVVGAVVVVARWRRTPWPG